MPEHAFYIVSARLVLCHLQEPDKAVAQMVKLLNDGGRLVLVDMDMRTPATSPPSRSTTRSSTIRVPVRAQIGVDYAIGFGSMN